MKENKCPECGSITCQVEDQYGILEECIEYDCTYTKRLIPDKKESAYDEGPYGGAFRDDDDFWRWKEGPGFFR